MYSETEDNEEVNSALDSYGFLDDQGDEDSDSDDEGEGWVCPPTHCHAHTLPRPHTATPTHCHTHTLPRLLLY